MQVSGYSYISQYEQCVIKQRSKIGSKNKGTAMLRVQVSFVVWMRGMDYFKEQRCGFEKVAENLVDGKEKQSESTEHGRGWSSIVGNTQ